MPMKRDYDGDDEMIIIITIIGGLIICRKVTNYKKLTLDRKFTAARISKKSQ